MPADNDVPTFWFEPKHFHEMVSISANQALATITHLLRDLLVVTFIVVVFTVVHRRFLIT